MKKKCKMFLGDEEIKSTGSFKLENKGHYKVFEFVDSVEIAQEILQNIPASEFEKGDEALFILPDGAEIIFKAN